jgi:hypothetical protein
MSTDTLALLMVMLFGFGVLFIAILLLSKETSKTPEIISRLLNVEMLTQQLVADVGMELNGANTKIWRSADGKYQANSFDELLQQMSADPDGPLSKDEIETIQSVFDKIMQMPDEDDDEPTENWQK